MLGALAQQGGRLVEDRGALLDVRRAPFGPGALGRGERLVDIGGGRERKLGDGAAGRGVDDGVVVAVLAGAPAAVDEQFEVGFISHGGADRRALMRLQRAARRARDKGDAEMTKQELVAKMQDGQAWLPGKRVKLDFGDEGAVMLDGAAQQVSEDDGDRRHHDQGRLGRLAGDGGRPARRHDRVHDRQAEGRGRHVERDAAAGRAGEVGLRRSRRSRGHPGLDPAFAGNGRNAENLSQCRGGARRAAAATA